MSFWIDDIDSFFNDFSVDVTLVAYPLSSGTTGATSNIRIKGIFDEAQKVTDIQTGQIVSARPQLTVKSSDVSSILRKSQIIVNSVTYYVLDILDDGTGITILDISERQ